MFNLFMRKAGSTTVCLARNLADPADATAIIDDIAERGFLDDDVDFDLVYVELAYL